jgi:hypothetical protein
MFFDECSGDGIFTAHKIRYLTFGILSMNEMLLAFLQHTKMRHTP